MSSALSTKTVDVLIENLRDALKAIDTSFLLAFTAIAFLLLHGIQGDYIAALQQRSEIDDSTRTDGVPDTEGETTGGRFAKAREFTGKT